jgi:hypothetical protein
MRRTGVHAGLDAIDDSRCRFEAGAHNPFNHRVSSDCSRQLMTGRR